MLELLSLGNDDGTQNLYDEIKNKDNKFIDGEEIENKKDMKKYYFKKPILERIKKKYKKEKQANNDLLLNSGKSL